MTEQKKQSFAFSLIRYTSSRIFKMLLGAITAFLRPKLLSPEHFGLWTLLKVIPTFAGYVHLGTRSALRYRIPFHAARAEDEQISTMKNTVFSASFVLNALVCLVLLVLCFHQGWTTQVRWGLAAIAGIILLQFVHENYLTLLKADERFELISRGYYLQATTALICSIPLLYYFGIYGLYLSVILAYLTPLLLFRSCYRQNISWGFNRREYKKLLREGFPILILEITVMLVMTSDRFLISWYLGNESLGYYGIAIMLTGFLRNAPGAAREIQEPRLMKALGSDESSQDVIRKHVLKPLLHTAYLMPLAIGTIFLALPEVIGILLPRYMPGVEICRILALGVYFLTLTIPLRPLIVARGWQVQAAMLLPLALMANLTLSFTLLRAGWGLRGVAIGSGVSFFLLLMLYLVFLSVKLRKEPAFSSWKKSLLHLLPPFPILLLMLYLSQTAIDRMQALPSLLSLILAEIMIGAGLLGLYLFATRRSQILK